MLGRGGHGLDDWLALRRAQCADFVDSLLVPGTEAAKPTALPVADELSRRMMAMLTEFFDMLLCPAMRSRCGGLDLTDAEKSAVADKLKDNRFNGLLAFGHGDRHFEACAHPWLRDASLMCLSRWIVRDFQHGILDDVWCVSPVWNRQQWNLHDLSKTETRVRTVAHKLGWLFQELRQPFERMVLEPRVSGMVRRHLDFIPAPVCEIICRYVMCPDYNARRRQLAQTLLTEHDRISNVALLNRRLAKIHGGIDPTKTIDIDEAENFLTCFACVDQVFQPLFTHCRTLPPSEEADTFLRCFKDYWPLNRWSGEFDNVCDSQQRQWRQDIRRIAQVYGEMRPHLIEYPFYAQLETWYLVMRSSWPCATLPNFASPAFSISASTEK